ncbi:hypothetical protein RND81_07G029300 [Saponaria officinalis]|uniref:GRF-type domain-containing protein n=1 Tax=Saponaria officinalis TaxID=3572 RepID=A0AAW1JQ10_SAPOF
MSSRSNFEAHSSSSNFTRMKQVFCKHNVGAVLRTVKKGKNVGRKFYGCAYWPENDCGYFVFVDDKFSETNSQNQGLRRERRCCKCEDEQIESVKLENRMLKKEVAELKLDVKRLVIVIIVFCVVFVFYSMFKNHI